MDRRAGGGPGEDEELLGRGAVASTTDATGRTAADWAERRRFPEIAARLRA